MTLDIHEKQAGDQNMVRHYRHMRMHATHAAAWPKGTPSPFAVPKLVNQDNIIQVQSSSIDLYHSWAWPLLYMSRKQCKDVWIQV